MISLIKINPGRPCLNVWDTPNFPQKAPRTANNHHWLDKAIITLKKKKKKSPNTGHSQHLKLWVWHFLLSFLYSLLQSELLTEQSNHWGGKPFCMQEPNMEETRTIAAHAQSKTPSEVTWSVGWWHHKLTWSKMTRRCLAQYYVLHSQPAQRHTSNEAHVSDWAPTSPQMWKEFKLRIRWKLSNRQSHVQAGQWWQMMVVVINSRQSEEHMT